MPEFFAIGLLPIILFVCVAIPAILFAVQAQKRRMGLAAGWAAARGCGFLQSNPALLPYLHGEPFIGGHSSKVQEFIDGVTPGGRTFCSFLYTYVVSSGKSSTTVMRTVVMVRLPATLPALSVTPERIGDKLQKFFGGQDIELESDEFNQRFRIKSPVEAFAYGVLHPRMMEWLMGPASGLVPFRIEGPDLLCWREGVPDYATLDGQLAAMCDFVDQIPQGVFEQYAAPPALGWTGGR